MFEEFKMEKVKMYASVGGAEIFCGECHPARARILVKKEVASWKDGKILLHVLGIHDVLLSNHPDMMAHGPLDDENVSKQEMERRMAWFRSIMTKSAEALSFVVPPFPTLEEATQWANQKSTQNSTQKPQIDPCSVIITRLDKNSPSYNAVREVFLSENVEKIVSLDSTVVKLRVENLGDLFTEANAMGDSTDVDPFYKDVVDEVVSDIALETLWESAPDVSAVFQDATPEDILSQDAPLEALCEGAPDASSRFHDARSRCKVYSGMKHDLQTEEGMVAYRAAFVYAHSQNDASVCGTLLQVRYWRHLLQKIYTAPSSAAYSLLAGTAFKIRPE
jgi:hypothetical protein